MKYIIRKISAVAITLFALITLFKSGSVIFDLFGIRATEGNYVLFVVVFNFICGFLYLFAAYGFFTQKRFTTSVLIASTGILIVSFIGLLMYIESGGIYEALTFKALLIRISITVLFTGISWFSISKTTTKEKTIKKNFKAMLVNTYLSNNLKPVIIIVLAMTLYTISLKTQTLSLEQCIDSALQHNQSIKISQHDIDITEEKYKEVKSNLLPKLFGIVDYRYNTNLPYQLLPAAVFGGLAGTYKEAQFGLPQNLNANVQLNIPLYNPSTFSNIQTTRLSIDLIEIQKTKAEEVVVLEVSNTYYNAQILLNQLTFLDSNIINTGILLHITTLMFQQQIIKGTDVDRLQLQLDQLNTQRENVLSQYRQALNAIKYLIGKPLTDTIEVLIEDKSTDVTSLYHKITTDIKLIDKILQLNNAELSGLRYSHLPSLNIYGLYGTTGYGNTGNNSFFKFYPISYIGVQLTIPIFNGMATKHKIEQKKIDITKTILQKEFVTEKNNLEITNTGLQYQTAINNVKIIVEQIELAKKIYSKTVLQNKQGVASTTDLIMADNSLREAQQNYILALVNLRKSELEYKKVTGNLLKKK